METLIVIVNHRSHELTIRCVLSIFEHCPGPLRVAIGDNSPESEAGILHEKLPDCTVIALAENRGFAAAVNSVLHRLQPVDNQLLLLLNPDTYCTSDFLSPLVTAFHAADTAGAVSPSIRATDGSIWYAGGEISFLKGGPKHHRNTKAGTATPVQFVTGCALLTSWHMYKQAGGLPEHYFLYFEDAHFSMVLQKQGYQLIWTPDAEIVHHVSATTDQKSALYGYLFARNRSWFVRSFGSPLQLSLFLLVHLCIRLPAALIFYGIIERKREHAHRYLQGVLDGLRPPASVPPHPVDHRSQ